MIDNLDEITDTIIANLKDKDEAREKLLSLSRQSIRNSALAIRAIHRHDYEKADEKLVESREYLDKAEKAAEVFVELTKGGIFWDAQKEYAEGCLVLALIKRRKLPTPAELSVDGAAYLNGIAEAVGELRRYLLDGIRAGNLSDSEHILNAMDEIYDVLVTIDFPDAITGGLRRVTDITRGILEKTRGDLALVIRQKNLEDKLSNQY